MLCGFRRRERDGCGFSRYNPLMQESLPALPQRKTLVWIIAGFFVAMFLVYGMSVATNRFVAWDDNYVVDFNPIVHGFTLDHLKTNFTSFVDPELYDPLTFISYEFDYTVGGLHPFIFHLHNLLDHTASALLVAWLLYLLSKKKWIGVVGGLLFAVHPLNVEAVAWASARKDTLSTFFFLLSLIFYIYFAVPDGTRKRKYYWLSIAAFILGLLSKVMVLTLPVILFLIDVRNGRKWSVKMILEKIPYLILSGIFGIVALFGKSTTVAESTVWQKVLMAAKSTTFYIEKFVWPSGLSVIYPYTKEITLSSPDFFIPIIVVLALIGIGAWTYRTMRDVSFGIFFYLLTLIPTFFNFAKGGEFYFASDRYAYVPQIGLLFLVLTLIDRFLLEGRGKKQMTTIVYTALVLILALFGILSFRQSLIWHDTQTLFVHNLEFYPDAVAARINLGLVYRESGLLDQAMDQFNAAIKIRPNNALIVTNIAATEDAQGKTDLAITDYKKAMQMDPKEPDAPFGLGMIYERQNKIDDAFALYEKVRELNPGYIGVYNNLGSIYVQKGDYASAEAMYKKAIDIDPFYQDAHYNLGFVEEKLGNLDAAVAEYQTTLQIEGDKVQTLTALAGIYAQQNKTAQTIDMLNRILKIDPQNTFASNLLNAMRQHGLAQ
jgi:tetratricopeptide (TPR) repeat protein